MKDIHEFTTYLAKFQLGGVLCLFVEWTSMQVITAAHISTDGLALLPFVIFMPTLAIFAVIALVNIICLPISVLVHRLTNARWVLYGSSFAISIAIVIYTWSLLVIFD